VGAAQVKLPQHAAAAAAAAPAASSRTSTVAGLCSRSDVTLSRSGVIVAETSIVCTEGGSASPMAAMSSP